MNEIIPIRYDESERPTVSGRDLHDALLVGTAYKDWFPRMCEYGFTEGKDFCSILSESTGGRPATDHQLTIAMAKEIAMLQRTEKGKQVRQYFISIEEAWNQPDMVIARGMVASKKLLDEARERIVDLEAKNHELAPKALFADSVCASDTSILVGDLAKILKQNGHNVGQNRLFDVLRQEGYLIKGGDRRNMPTQRAMELGLFEVKERTVDNPDGSVRITKTTKVTGKGQVYFVNKYVGKEVLNG